MNNQTNQAVSEKYSRQILLNEIGTEGQKKLLNARVAIIGVGALGTIAAELLTRAGVGNLLLVDRDIVEESNLQRQTLFIERDVGKSKAMIAQKKLQKINSTITVNAEAISLGVANIEILKNYDLLLDCTDNFQTRFLINDFAKKSIIPWVYSSAIKTEGYVMPIFPEGPCLQCFLRNAVGETCDTVGILNTITTSIAALQVTLVLQILLQKKVPTQLYYYNIWHGTFQKITIKKNPACATCNRKYLYLERKVDQNIRYCKTGKFQMVGKKPNCTEIKKRWLKLGKVIDDGTTLRFKNIILFKDGRALITAKNKLEALSVYAKYVGD